MYKHKVRYLFYSYVHINVRNYKINYWFNLSTSSIPLTNPCDTYTVTQCTYYSTVQFLSKVHTG